MKQDIMLSDMLNDSDKIIKFLKDKQEDLLVDANALMFVSIFLLMVHEVPESEIDMVFRTVKKFVKDNFKEMEKEGVGQT